ncbi:hypothetical protein ACLQ2N_08445 [Streptomyces sp. DT224]|uniref:hypothetical protein n=1 Tax=Streptomyces sp. DT224 TaxID=3393426 RepID=UPI003CF1B42B
MSDEFIPAPIAVGVRAIPGGARLLLDAFTQAVIEDVLDALLSTDPGSDLYERLVALAELEPSERALLPEHRMPYEELVTDLAARASTHTHVYGGRGLVLAERVAVAAVQSLPAGHWGADALWVWQAIRGEAEALAEARAAVKGGAAA